MRCLVTSQKKSSHSYSTPLFLKFQVFNVVKHKASLFFYQNLPKLFFPYLWVFLLPLCYWLWPFSCRLWLSFFELVFVDPFGLILSSLSSAGCPALCMRGMLSWRKDIEEFKWIFWKNENSVVYGTKTRMTPTGCHIQRRTISMKTIKLLTWLCFIFVDISPNWGIICWGGKPCPEHWV